MSNKTIVEVSSSKRQAVFDFLKLPEEEREPLKEFLKRLGMSMPVYNNYKYQHRKATGAQGVQDYDSDRFLKSRTREADQSLMRACRKGNPTALKIFYELNNRLVEKQEQKITHKLEGDDYFRLRNEAKTSVQPVQRNGDGEFSGDREVLSEHTLLLKEPCVCPEQEQEQNGQMASVAVSS